MYIDWWMGKDVIYIHNGMLLNHKKEQNLAICNKVDGAREYFAKWNKLEKDKYHTISLICGIEETKQMTIWEVGGEERERETNHKRLLTIENKLRVARGVLGELMG